MLARKSNMTRPDSLDSIIQSHQDARDSMDMPMVSEDAEDFAEAVAREYAKSLKRPTAAASSSGGRTDKELAVELAKELSNDYQTEASGNAPYVAYDESEDSPHSVSIDGRVDLVAVVAFVRERISS